MTAVFAPEASFGYRAGERRALDGRFRPSQFHGDEPKLEGIRDKSIEEFAVCSSLPYAIANRNRFGFVFLENCSAPS